MRRRRTARFGQVDIQRHIELGGAQRLQHILEFGFGGRVAAATILTTIGKKQIESAVSTAGTVPEPNHSTKIEPQPLRDRGKTDQQRIGRIKRCFGKRRSRPPADAKATPSTKPGHRRRQRLQDARPQDRKIYTSVTNICDGRGSTRSDMWVTDAEQFPTRRRTARSDPPTRPSGDNRVAHGQATPSLAAVLASTMNPRNF